MRKILNSNAFLAFVLVILISMVVYILFDEHERKKNVKILNELVKEEKNLRNIKASYEALLKDMEEEEGEIIKEKNDNSSNDIKNSKDDNKEIINSENDNDIKNSEKDNVIKSEDDSKKIVNSEKEENLSSVSDKKIIIRSIEELSKTISENDAQIIDIFHKKARISKEDREKLEKIKGTFSEALVEHAANYKKLSLIKKNSLETDKGNIGKKK